MSDEVFIKRNINVANVIYPIDILKGRRRQSFINDCISILLSATFIEKRQSVINALPYHPLSSMFVAS